MIPLLRMRKIIVCVIALALFVAAPASAAAGSFKPPKPAKSYLKHDKGFADGN